MFPFPWGFGDKSGKGAGGFGVHEFGFGHPFKIVGLGVAGGTERPDLGGDILAFDTVNPGFLPAGPFSCWIGGVLCYSGVSGQGTDIYADAALQRWTCVLPHLYGTLGPVDVRIEGAGGFVHVWAGAIEIVRHVARTSTTMLALRHPREVYSQPVFTARS